MQQARTLPYTTIGTHKPTLIKQFVATMFIFAQSVLTLSQRLKLSVPIIVAGFISIGPAHAEDNRQISATPQYLAQQNDLLNHSKHYSQLHVASSASTSTENTIQARGLGSLQASPDYIAPILFSINNSSRSTQAAALLDLVDIKDADWQTPSLLGNNENYVAGKLNLRTITPELGKKNIAIYTSVGDFGSRRISGVLNQGFDDEVSALRIAASYRESNGSVENTSNTINNTIGKNNNLERFAVRGQYLLQPNEHVKFHLNTDYAKTLDNCCSAGILLDSSGLNSTPSLGTENYFILAGLSDSGIVESGARAFDNRLTNTEIDKVEIESENYSLISEFKFAGLKLSYIPSYSVLDSQSREDQDFSALEVVSSQSPTSQNNYGSFDETSSISHQFKLGNLDNEKTTWEIGLFYKKSKTNRTETTILGNDYQQYLSAAALSQLDQIAFETVDEAIFADTNAFYADFSTNFPSIDPLTSTNIQLSLTNANNIVTNAANNFATNSFSEDRSSTALYVKNSYQITPAIKLDWELKTSIEKIDANTSQIDALSSACDASLANGDLLGVLTESNNLANSMQLNALYSDLFHTLQENACPSATTLFNTTDLEGRAIAAANNESHKSANWNGSIGTEIHISDTTRASIRFASNTKPGGVNLNPSANGLDAQTYEHERHHIYEIAINTSLHNKYNSQAELSIFHHDIDNLQVDAPYASSARTLRWRGNVINLNEAMTSGFQLTAKSDLFERLTGSLSYSYIDARSASNCFSSAGDAFSETALCGRNISQTPESSAFLSLSYNRRWNEQLEWSLRSEFIYESERQLSDIIGFSIEEDLRLDSSLTANLFFTLNNDSTSNIPWKLNIYAVNLADEQPARQAFNIANRPGAIAAFYDEPRHFGVAFTISN